MWLKGLTLEGKIVRNPSVSLSPTLTRNEKVEHYIRIKTHKPIAKGRKGVLVVGQLPLEGEKVEHHIRIKAHKPIIVLSSETPSVKPDRYFIEN